MSSRTSSVRLATVPSKLVFTPHNDASGCDGYATDIANKIASTTGLPFTSAGVAGMFSTLVCSLNKIANDVQLLGSSPRCGLGELSLPENESCPAKFQHNVRH